MYESLNNLWTLFFDFTMIHFRSVSRLWSLRMFHNGNSDEYSVYTDRSHSYTVEILPYSLRAKGFVMFSFFISLSVIFNECVTSIPSFLVFALILTHLDMWTRLRLPSKSFCLERDVVYSSLDKPGLEILRMFSFPNMCITGLIFFVSSSMLCGFCSRSSSVTSLSLRRRT